MELALRGAGAWLRAAVFGLAVLAVLLLLLAGPGTRLELWHFGTGFQLLRLGAYAGIAAAALALVALLIPRLRRGGAGVLALALVLGVSAAAVPWTLRQQARAAPLLNDVSTAQPPPAYPELRPLVLPLPADQAFARARAAAEDMGWEIVAADPAAGRLEAVARTFWFGFRDDVTVRITPQAGGSRVDVRSRSRVGRGDAGTNARRIRAYLEQLQ